MSKKKQIILLFFLFLFSSYCAVTIGQSWDEGFHFLQGKITFDYLFSFGRLDKDIFYREFYSPIYWSIQYFLTQIFPSKYQIESSHLVNLIFSLGAIFAIGNVSKELFNKKVSKIVFLVLFFYPVFFGQMGFNPKDTILTFCHVWIFYSILKYLKNQTNKYVANIGILAAMGTGIQLFFLGSLIPIFIFFICEIFIFKKIIYTNFDKKRFLYDLLKCFLIFYILLVLFWVDTHSNIFVLPFEILMKTLSADFYTGVPFNLINGNYYYSTEIPKLYLFINFIYKSPEYFLITYILFAFLFINSKDFFINKFELFNYKLLLLILILLYPNLILFFVPFPIYDGMRLFLWTLPYFCLIPGLTIYYLIDNLKFLKVKIIFVLLCLCFFYFFINFLIITPYQYTYLNIFNGKKENRYQKFENDYWGASLKELINKSNLDFNKTIKFATCGVNAKIAKYYFKKKGNHNFRFVSASDASYIIMTNRVTWNGNFITCFDNFKGTNISKVERNNLILSVIRKID